MTIFRATMGAFRNIHDRLNNHGVKPHPDIAHAFTIHDALQAAHETPKARILDLTPEQSVERALNLAHRQVTHLHTSRTAVEDQLTHEVFDVFTNDVDRIIEELRPTFDKAATAIRAAIQAGITAGTTADRILELEHPKAIQLWKALPGHLDVIRDIVRLRIDFSEELGIRPQPYNAASGPVNYGCLIVKPSESPTPNIPVHHLWRGPHMFLRPDLHLATQTEVEEMLKIQRNLMRATA